VPVREVAGEPIYQAYIGSSANPGWRDFAIVAEILRGKATPLHVSLDINPTSRQTLEMLANDGRLGSLVASGARVHQAGCNGCIGMGQAPAAGRNSLRTIPCNSPGRSGTKEDRVWLCSPETAAASALTGRITDPRTLSVPYPSLKRPALPHVNMAMFSAPLSEGEARHVAFLDASHAIQLPKFDALPDVLEMPVALKMGDHVSTDDIVVAGTCVFPYGSNEQKTDDFCFARVKPDYVERMRAVRGAAGLAVVAGENHGQGACREHATIALRKRGLHVVLAKSFARIHRQNLINYGVLPLTFAKSEDYNRIREGDVLFAHDLRNTLEKGNDVALDVVGKGTLSTRHGLTVRQVEIVLAGGLINCRRTIPAINTQTSTQADHLR
jgi:aconitate hydratase